MDKHVHRHSGLGRWGGGADELPAANDVHAEEALGAGRRLVFLMHLP